MVAKREAEELLMIEEADAWFEYLEATRSQAETRYHEIEPWAWARLSQRLRAIKARRARLRPACTETERGSGCHDKLRPPLAEPVPPVGLRNAKHEPRLTQHEYRQFRVDSSGSEAVPARERLDEVVADRSAEQRYTCRERRASLAEPRREHARDRFQRKRLVRGAAHDIRREDVGDRCLGSRPLHDCDCRNS